MEKNTIIQDKKVGIITLSGSDNCGSLLQAYALQKAIEKYTSSVEIINFKNEKSKKMYRIFHPSYIKQPKKLLGTLLYINRLIKQQNEYQLFRDNHMKLTNHEYASSKQLLQISHNYDILVSGSDQIWNTNMADFDSAYLLDWANGCKKIAYAASLGDQKNSQLTGLKAYETEIKDYDYISIRENSSKSKIKEFLGIDTTLALDPTFLITKNEWENLLDEENDIDSPFIFYYSYNYADDIKNNMVKQFAKEKNLPVYVINYSRWLDGKNKKFGFNIYHKSGPLAFLKLMKYCKYSLVESFHGTVFSFIFEKQFWFLKNKNDNILDDRINDIMEILDTKDRVLCPKDVASDKINKIKTYQHNERYNHLLEQSKTFLFNSLRGE